MRVPPRRRRPNNHQRGRAALWVLAAVVAAAVLLAPWVLDGSAAGGPGSLAPARGQSAGDPGASPRALVAVGSAVPAPAGATALGPLAATTPLHLDVVLRPRDPSALDAFVSSVSDPSSPGYGHYLARGAFSARFGPSASSTTSLRAGLGGLGLHVGAPSADGLLLSATTTAGQASASLHIDFEQYRLATGQQVYANDQAPQLPRSLAADVTSLSGLSTIPPAVPLLGKPAAAAATGPAASPATGGATPCSAATSARRGGYTWNQLAATYGFTSAYGAGHLGAGETVGLFELQPYRPSDVTAFESCYTLPAGASWGAVHNVVVDGGPGAGAGNVDVEAVLDIEDVLGLAPESQVLVYGAPNTNDGLLQNYDRMVTDDRAQVLSTSWGECERASTVSVLRGENEIFEEAAAQGQSMFAASGDDGSADCDVRPILTTKLTVDDPASQPYVTGVGGTRLLLRTTGSTESTWSDGGGGVSLEWQKPAWQSVTGSPSPTGDCTTTPGAATTSAACRQVPDVSASADPTQGDVIYVNGAWAQWGGTSAAAPLWAAMAALADQGCSSNLGFVNPRLYALGESGDVRDITTGTNDYRGLHPGDYTAGPGYDNATGWGSPTASFLSDACQQAVTSPTLTPPTLTAGATGVTYHVGFATPSGGGLSAGDTVTVTAPSGTMLPGSASDYAVAAGGSVAVSSVRAVATGGSPTANAVVLTLGGSIQASTEVSTTVHGATNATVAGAGAVTIATTADPVPARAAVTVVPAAPSASASALVVAAPSTTADGTASDAVTATVRDAFGNAVTGATVSLSANDGTQVKVTPPSTSTGAGGTAVFHVSDAVSETATLSARVTSDGGLQLNAAPEVDFTRLTGAHAAFSPDVAGDTTATLTTSFATSSTGALGPGSTVLVLAPGGTALPSAPGDYSVLAGTGSATVASVVTAAVNGSLRANKATLTLGTSTIASSDVVTVAVSQVAVPSAAGSAALGVATSADPVPADPTVTVAAGAPDAVRSSVTPSAPSVPADGVDTDTATVSVADAASNPVAGATVSLSVVGSSATVTPPSAVSSSSGLATFTVRDATAQAVTLTATAGTVQLTPVTVTFTDLSGLTYQLLTPGTSPPTAEDVAGATADITASFNLDGGITGPGSITLTAPTGTILPATPGAYSVTNIDTDSQASVSTVSRSTGTNVATVKFAATHGMATADTAVALAVVGATNPSASGNGYASVTASGSGNSVASTAVVTIAPSTATAAQSSIVAGPSDVVANGSSSALVTVTVRDAHANPIPGQVVSLAQGTTTHSTVTGDGSTQVAGQSTTNAQGAATFTVRDTTAEVATYSADDVTAGVGIAQKATVTFTTPGSPSDLGATLSDSRAGTSPTVLSASFTTSATGALNGGLGGTPTVTVMAPSWAPLPQRSSAYQVRDGSSGIDPVRRVAVTGGNQAVLVLGDTGISDSDAVTVSVAGLTNPEPAGHYALSVATSADTTAEAATTAVTPAKPSPTASTTVATPATVPADGGTTATVTVTERDRFTEPVPGDTVILHASAGSHATVTPASAPASATGVVTFQVSDAAVQTVTFTPVDTTAGVTLGSSAVNFTRPADETSPNHVSVVPGSPDRAFVAGAQTTYDVAFTTSPTGGLSTGSTISVAGPTGTLWPSTPADYLVTGTPASSVSGSGTDGSPLEITLGSLTVAGGQAVSLVVADVADPTAATTGDTLAVSTSSDTAAAVSASYDVVAAAPSPTSTVQATPGAAAVGAPVTVTVAVHDAFGNPVAGDAISLTPQHGSHATVTPPTADTSGTGTASFTVSDTSTEQVTLTATDTTAHVILTEQPTVTFVKPQVSAVTVTPASLAAGTTATLAVSFTTSLAGSLGAGSTITIDGPTGTTWPNTPSAYALSGASAVSAVAVTGSSTTQVVVTLSASHVLGGTTATLTVEGARPPTAAGPTHLSLATSADDALVASNTVSVVPGAATPNGPVVASATSAQVGTAVTVSVTVTDRYKNPITTAGVSLTGSPGSHAVVEPTTATPMHGVATFTVTDAVGEAVTLTASLPVDHVVFSQTPTVTFVAQPAPPPPPPPPPPPARRAGYWLVASDGGIFSFGDADFYGSTGAMALAKPIVGMASTPDGGGYWLVASDGGIFSFGDANFYGSTGAMALAKPIVGMASTPDGGGYWLVASDGGIFSFGDADFYGSTGAMALAKPIVGMASTPDGGGYWLVASDGGIFSFGDADFYGSTGAMALAKPIVGMASTPDGGGYWLVASDGGIFSFGDADFYGSTGAIALAKPIVGMASTPDGGGYWLVASDGGIFSFGDADFYGSTGAMALAKPIVGMATT